MNYKIARNGDYKAVEKSKAEDIEHFKYVSKEKKNGKWVYYYTDRKGNENKIYKQVDGKPGSEYGSYVHKSGGKTEYLNRYKGNKWLNSSKTVTTKDGTTVRAEYIGLVEQYSNKAVKSIKKNVNKAKKWLSKLFG